MNKMPEILEGDLIEFDNHYTVSVWKEKHGLAWEVDYSTSDEGFITYVEEAKDEIIAIYRKQGKDYICIWERV